MFKLESTRMKPIKAIPNVIISMALSISIYFLLDTYLTRGHFTQKIYSQRLYEDAIDGSSILDFQINRLENGNYCLKIKNRKPSIFYFRAYRNDKIFLNKNQIKIFNYGRIKIETPIYKSKQSSGFDCGTGLGLININPYEGFTEELNYDQFLEKISLKSQVTRKRNTTYYDIIYDKPLIQDKRMIGSERNNENKIVEMDSISVSFYLPVYSIISGQEMIVSSNSIKISYQDVLNKLMEKYNNLD